MTDKTKLHPDNCPSCNGMGVTPETSPVVRVGETDGKRTYKTEEIGSGCPNCYGTGRIVRR